jgi:hypothetical protein
MASSEEYAQWIVDNQKLQGTPEFETVAKAYQESKVQDVVSAQPKIRDIPAYQSAIVGGGKGVTDPLLAAGQYVGGKPAEFSNEVLRRMKPFQEANPVSFGAGQVGGGILTGAPLLKGAQAVLPSFAKLGPYLQGSAVGGMMGVLTPNEQGKSGLDALADAPQKAMYGAGGGAIGTGLGRSLAGVLSPNIDPAARKLINEGVNLTPGQMAGGWLKTLEDKATSVPLLGDVIQYSRTKGIEEFNKAAYRKALDPIGGTVPESTGREGIRQVKQQITNAYDSLLPKVTFKADNTLLNNLSKIKDEVTGITPENAKKVADNVFDVISSRIDKNGEIKGDVFKVVEEKLGGLAKTFSASTDADQKLMGDAYNIALGELRQNLARNNPKYAKELNNINTAFANYARLRSAGSMANTQDLFTPSQLAAAVRSADKSAGKGATATGKALMQDLSDAATSTLPNKIPDSGTAGRNAINSALGALLGGGGAYAAQSHPVSVGAAALGGATLAAPYIAGGRNIATMLGAKRPEVIQKLADLIRESSPYLATSGAQKAVEKSENK